MIEVRNLVKYYGDHMAVDHLNFTIQKGQIYGFLGPNGAGKSTTMNIMTGCLSATSGSVSIGEYDIFEQPIEAKKLIGYLPEKLKTAGSPTSCDPEAGTFAYYAPWGNLAIFYRDFRHSEGLVPLGSIRSGLPHLTDMPDGVSVYLEPVPRQEKDQ